MLLDSQRHRLLWRDCFLGCPITVVYISEHAWSLVAFIGEDDILEGYFAMYFVGFGVDGIAFVGNVDGQIEVLEDAVKKG